MAGKGKKKKKKKRSIAAKADARLTNDADSQSEDAGSSQAAESAAEAESIAEKVEFKRTEIDSEPANMEPVNQDAVARPSDAAEIVQNAAAGLAAASISTLESDAGKNDESPKKAKKGKRRRQGLSQDPSLPDPANTNTKGPLIFLFVIFGLMAGMIALQFLEQ